MRQLPLRSPVERVAVAAENNKKAEIKLGFFIYLRMIFSHPNAVIGRIADKRINTYIFEKYFIYPLIFRFYYVIIDKRLEA